MVRVDGTLNTIEIVAPNIGGRKSLPLTPNREWDTSLREASTASERM